MSNIVLGRPRIFTLRDWDDAAILRIARNAVLDAMERHGPVAGWVVDDTGFPKKGQHSVGVARQYCGALGKQDNCQVVVTLTLANEAVSVPAAYRLYLPESWAGDAKRRVTAGVPDDVAFETKWQIALKKIDGLRADELPLAPVLADAGYGNVAAFREALTERKLPYVVGISGETTVWPPGAASASPTVWTRSTSYQNPARWRAASKVRSRACPTYTLAQMGTNLLEGRNARQDELPLSPFAGQACAPRRQAAGAP